MAPQALTFVLELLSLDAVRFVCRRKGGAKLYAQGVACNFINNAVLGPPLYELVSNRWMSQPFTPLGRAAMVLAVIWGHSIGYYCSHRWMHTKRMYWAHKFHHKFNVVVVPVTRGTYPYNTLALALTLAHTLALTLAHTLALTPALSLSLSQALTPALSQALSLSLSQPQASREPGDRQRRESRRVRHRLHGSLRRRRGRMSTLRPGWPGVARMAGVPAPPYRLAASAAQAADGSRVAGAWGGLRDVWGMLWRW